MSDSYEDHPPPAEIRPIEEESVRRIVAGQAVTDLASAVKELVDNSLDANSQSINIRLFNQGLDIVEVSDDGIGVPPASRPYMATPHATSKIRTFEDLYKQDSATTMGFRGEALFCLANLSEKLLVATRTEDEGVAQKMEFRRDGSLDPNSISEMHRKIGTTVAVMKLLDPLPVRRKDLMRRIQQHRSKLIRMMEGYAIFSVGVAISLRDMVPAGKSLRENLLLATSLKNRSVEANISSIMGSRFLSDLSAIEVDLTSCQGGDKNYEQPKLQGFVSCARPKGSNRQQRQQTNQRVRSAQFFSINGRPVELPQVSRILTDAWRAFGSLSDGKKRPSCVFCFSLPNDAYDINLSPEKRQVLLMKEKVICQLIHEAVTKLWSSQTEGIFTQNEPQVLGKRPARDMEQRSADASLTSDPSPFSPGSRKRHRRRYAFVHDFNNAKMQHEQAGREVLPTESQCTQTDVEVSQQETSNEGRRLEETDKQLCATSDQKVSSSEKTSFAPQNDVTIKDNDYTSRDGRNNMKRTSESTNVSEEDLNGKKCLDPQLSVSVDACDDSALDRNVVSPKSGTKKFDEITQPPPSSGPGTTIRKVSNDNFTSTKNDCCETSIEPNAVSPADEKIVQINEELEKQSKRFQDLQKHISSDGERRHWIETQSRFNRADNPSQEEDIQALSRFANQVSPPQRDEFPQAKTVARSRLDASKTSILQNFSSNREAQKNTLNLKHFAFGCVSNDNADASPSSQKESDTLKSPSLLSACKKADSVVKSEGPTNNADLIVKSRGYQVECSNIQAVSLKRDPRVAMNSTSQIDIPKRQSQQDHSIKYSQRSEETQIEMLESLSQKGYAPKLSQESDGSQIEIQENRYRQGYSPKLSQESEGSQIEILDNHSQQGHSPKLSQESEVGTSHTNWESFNGTKDIVLLSRLKRTKMINDKRGIHKIALRSAGIHVNGHMTANASPKVNFDKLNNNDTISLSKGDFAEMTVIGQFNLGFILAKCRNNHLWILDQHACDEKFNFEHLIKNTVIHEQKLIAPMPLELSPSEESCILDHMDIFEKNGFRFKYNPDKPPRHRLSLTTLPHSGARDGRKAVQFGKEDVSALCSMLVGVSDGHDASSEHALEGGGTGVDGSGMHGNNAVRRYAGATTGVVGDTADKIITRLPKAVAMFASRACRSSIMIGTALSQKEMEKVVKRLDDMDDPWSCAHGRPTMSHVGNLHQILMEEKKRDANHIAGPTVTMMLQDAAEPL